MSMEHAGLDRREWETEWQQLEPLVVDSPHEALPELDDLVARMMVAAGYPVEQPSEEDAAEPEIYEEFLAAREVARVIERGETVDPSDVGEAVASYRRLYEHLLERTPGSGGYEVP